MSHVRGPLVWVLLFLALLASMSINPASFVASGGPAADGTAAYVNSMHAMAMVFSLGGFMVYTLFAAIMAGRSVIRDDEVGMSELLHSTPLTPTEYVIGRFSGVFGVLLGVLLVHIVCVVIWYEWLPFHGLADQRGPFRVSAYLVPALLFAAPSAWLGSGLAFFVGERTRRSVAVYAVPIVLLGSVLFFLWTWSPPGLSLGAEQALMVLDPSGLRWLRVSVYGFHQGVNYYNENPIAFDAALWAHLAFWTVFPLVAVLASIPHARKVARGSENAAPRRLRSASLKRKNTEKGQFRTLSDLSMRVAPSTLLRDVRLIATAELVELRSQPILLLLVPVVVLMVLEFATTTDALGAPILLTAGTMAVRGIPILTVLVCLVVLFTLVESLHRERTTGLADIHYAMPYGTASLLLGKNLANAVLIGLMVGASIVAGVVQLILQGGPVQLWPFLLVWVGVLTPTFLVWSAFVTLMASVFRSRVAAYAGGVLMIVLTLFLFSSGRVTWVNNWILWGTLRWSDMGVFSLNGWALLVNRMLITGVAVLLATCAIRLYERSQRDGPFVLSVVPRLRPAAVQLGIGSMFVLVLAGYLAWMVHTGFQGAAASASNPESSMVEDMPSPELVHLDLDADIRPADRMMDVQGRFLLANRTQEAISRIPFALGFSFGPVQWSSNGVDLAHARNGDQYDLVALNDLLLPGDSVTIEFSYELINPRGSTRNGGGLRHFILPSGVLVSTLRGDFLPILAGVLADPPGAWTARIEVTAPQPYTVTSTGRRISSRSHPNGETVVWETDHPVRDINIMAGRWDVAQNESTFVYHHPAHTYNVQEILSAAVNARQEYSEWFGPYPWEELRINEFPDLESNATSFPTNISFSEGIGFLTKPDASARLAYAVTAHEVAHQWWGNLIAVDSGPGSGVLLEGMANFATLVLLEQEHPRSRMAYAKWLERGYATNRRLDSEVPLLKNSDETARDETGSSGRGALSLWMLSEYLGRDAMQAGLLQASMRYREGLEQPSLIGLLDALSEFASDSSAYSQFTEQLFGSIALPDIRIPSSRVAESRDGWQINAVLENVGTAPATFEVSASRGTRWHDDFQEMRIEVMVPAGASIPVNMDLDFKPTSLTVDPDALIVLANRRKGVVRL